MKNSEIRVKYLDVLLYYYLTGWLTANIRLLWCEESSCVSAENQITLHIGVNLTDSEQREEKEIY